MRDTNWILLILLFAIGCSSSELKVRYPVEAEKFANDHVTVQTALNLASLLT